MVETWGQNEYEFSYFVFYLIYVVAARYSVMGVSLSELTKSNSTSSLIVV
jgi:hypothetical protein